MDGANVSADPALTRRGRARRESWQLALPLAMAALMAPASRTSAQADTPRWTFESAEQVALSRSPGVRSALAARSTARAYGTFGRLPPVDNPFVNLRALVGKPDDPAATYSVVVGLPFEVGGRRRAWRKEARFVEEEAEARLQTARNEVRAEARAAYAEVGIAAAARAVAEESTRTAKELYDRVKARVDAQAATALDLTLSETQYAEAQADLERARRSLVEAEHGLRQVLDLPPSEVVEIEPLGVPQLPEGLSLESAIARGLSLRKEPAIWQSAEQRARAADKRLWSEAIAPVTVAFDAERQGNKQTNTSVGASVGFEVPVVQRNQGERAIASQEANAAAVEREIAEHAIAREIATAYRRLEAALAELLALDERALPAAERTLAMTRTLLDSGAIDYFRLLSARGSAFAVRKRRVEALREAWRCRIELARAIGFDEAAP